GGGRGRLGGVYTSDPLRARKYAPPRRRPVTRLRGVDKTYRPRRGELARALENITLDVAENEFVTLVGPSGCGKSTLLKLVAGLTPVSGGTVRVRDSLVHGPFPDVGIVFQHPVLLPWRTVLDNVLFSADMLGLDPQRYRTRALELLALSGLGGSETRLP